MDEAKSMTTTMDAVPPGSDVRRTVAIDFLFLDLSTCERCSGTGANIETALAAIEDVLRATGARVELRKIHVQSVQQARELRFVELANGPRQRPRHRVGAARERVRHGRVRLWAGRLVPSLAL